MSTDSHIQPALPLAERRVEDLPGHWLLARLGKKVLRPGGRELTNQLIDAATVSGRDVVEFAPGLGQTAKLILDRSPKTYIGVDEDPDAAVNTQISLQAPGINRDGVPVEVIVGEATSSGLPDASADLVVGEAMLTMQTDKHKAAIIAEVARILCPGGQYAIHELSLQPNNLSDEKKTEIRKALARAIKVNARPLTTDEWCGLLEAAGFEVEFVAHAPMHLLKPRRMVADEGIVQTAKIAKNVLKDKAVRERIMGMRSTFNEYADYMGAIAIVATKPIDSGSSAPTMS